ncbi:hypothetical protein [Mucilaginibacter sp. OK098]|uniref:hypothetical protein n=1 Tax=Mucilaginibacter sp. OK098 TaxID=1855297 RepID=UPI000913E63C|nr:hypothetical protein [Mucilaginibacter sp. OK098]SHN27608.1 hypothetical protein SAMN05216524_10853 [Mucilaginibacter sp. OK098]
MKDEEKFAQQHEVMVILKKKQNCFLENENVLMTTHLVYYKNLYERKKIVRYGKVLNDDSICILLNVLSDLDFEQLIISDPAYDKLFEIVKVTPFVNDDFML